MSHSAAAMKHIDCARYLSAVLHRQGPSHRHAFVGVSTDSRTIVEGQLFVALSGESFDGHDYVVAAQKRGAAAALVSRKVEVDIPQLIVGDTMWAYGQLAQYWRSRFSLPIIAITGSNGKTTVKEMLRSILVAYIGDKECVLATEGNLNNNIGVPQMLLRLNRQHQVAVIEMGMNHLNEIDYLTRLVVPNVALIIMAGTAHIGELGSREAIAAAKGEIYAGLRTNGISCVNADDRFADFWRGLNGGENGRRVITFGTDKTAEVRGELIPNGIRLVIHSDLVEICSKLAGEHNQRNVIAAAAGAFALGVPFTAIKQGLETFSGVDGRLCVFGGLNETTVIDDTYNANPDSMRAAIAVLAAKNNKRLLVLGDMGELGKDAAQMHAEIGREAKGTGIDEVFAIGELAIEYVRGFGLGASHYKSVDALIAGLLPRMTHGATVLVKGSRFMKMERIVEKIVPLYQKDKH